MMLPKGVGTYIRIFLGLFVGLLCFLHLLREDFREESGALLIQHNSRYKHCCLAPIFSAGKGSHLRGDIACIECRHGSLAASAGDLQGPTGLISGTGSKFKNECIQCSDLVA